MDDTIEFGKLRGKPNAQDVILGAIPVRALYADFPSINIVSN